MSKEITEVEIWLIDTDPKIREAVAHGMHIELTPDEWLVKMEEYAQSKPVSNEEKRKIIVEWETHEQEMEYAEYDHSIESEIDRYLKR